MQAITPLALSDFTAPVNRQLLKYELFYGGFWQTPEAIIGDTGGQLLRSMRTSLGPASPQISVIAGSWSAEIYNPAAIFHPLNPTATYTDVLKMGRRVRLSAGIRVGVTDYYWPVMCGIISLVDYDTRGAIIRLSGYDYAQVLTDYKLREFLDLNFGGVRTFVLADGSNVVPNGTFDVDISGWTAFNGIVSSNASGYSGQCLEVATDDEVDDRIGYQRGRATMTGFVVGGRYAFSFWTAKGTQNWTGVSFVAGTSLDANDVCYLSFQALDDGWVQCAGEFIASAETLYIALEKSSPAPNAAGSMLFDELEIHQVQVREHPMTAVEYPLEAAATGAFLLRQQMTPGPPPTWENFFINEDFTWDRATSTLIFNSNWEMPAAATTFAAYVYEAFAPEDIVFFILANSGLYASYATAKADAIYTATGITIDRVGFDAGTSGLEAIQLIAERCRYQFYFRYDGKPVFIPKPAIKADGLEDLNIGAALIADDEYLKNDKEFYNRIILTGELQDRESKDDTGDKAALMADVSDEASIAANGEKALPITNTLWQDQTTIDAAAADYLAAMKTAKAYIPFKLRSCPLPAVVGDTVKVAIPLTHGAGGVTASVRGLVRDIKLDGYDRTLILEVAEG